MALLVLLVNGLGWQNRANRRSTSWRNLNAKQRDNLNKAKAKQLMIEYPALIKRPIFDTGGTFMIGYSQEEYRPLV